MELHVRFSFRAKHAVKVDNKREDTHIHRFLVEITLEGEPSPDLIVDFLEVDKVAKEEIVKKFDGRNLNDYFENPTSENIVRYIYETLKEKLKGPNFYLKRVTLWETPRFSVTYEPYGKT